MERTDVQRLADSVLRDYGVPMKVSTISAAASGWTIAFAGSYGGARSIEVSLNCERSSPYLLRESLKKSLNVGD
jgi:hypothetical protein